MAKICLTCKGPITSHGRDTKQCGTCWAAARIFCRECGVELDKRNQRTKICRPCWHKQHPPRFCEGCGDRLALGTRTNTKRCGACTARKPIPCLACGKDLSETKSYGATRCWDCWSTARLLERPTTCSVTNCDQPPTDGRRVCYRHVLAQQRARRAGAPRRKDWRPKVMMAKLPCAVCEYDRLPSHVHRVIPGAAGGQYEIGNMVPLCARCHAEVHRGLTPCPEPVAEIVLSEAT